LAPKRPRRRPLPPGQVPVYFRSPKVLDARIETVAEFTKLPKRDAMTLILDLGLQAFTGLVQRAQQQQLQRKV
jgi:hypothetical protein